MASLDDKQQLLQNTQALMIQVAEASGKALEFAKRALDVKPSVAKANGPVAETVRLGIAALKEGAAAAQTATMLSQECIEITEALEDMYASKESEGGSD